MADEINISMTEAETIVVALTEPQPINITLGQVFDSDLAVKIAQILSIFTPPEGDYSVVKLYVPSSPPYKLKVEYEGE